MNKICTNIEQSKKLIELGIDINSSDCSWILSPRDEHYILSLTTPLDDDIPSWSLSALLKMFPNGLWYNNDYTVPILLPQIKNKWICRLYNPEKDIDIFYIKDNPFDAVFEMIVWLKEKEKI